MRMQVILVSSFARPGSGPKWGQEEKESSGTAPLLALPHGIGQYYFIFFI